MTETCRSCDAPVVWCTTDRGDRMPVDADPVPHGNIAVTPGPRRSVATVLDGEEVVAARARGARLHLSHFATCPAAKEWRRS